MSYPHELPDLAQKPADFRRNMTNFSAFISDTMDSVINLNKKLDDLGMVEVNEKQCLDKSEVEKMLEDFVPKKEFESSIGNVKRDIETKIKPLAIGSEIKSLEKSLRLEFDKAVNGARSDIEVKISNLAKTSELENTKRSLKSELDNYIVSIKKDIDEKTYNLAKISELEIVEKSLYSLISNTEKSLSDKVTKLSSAKHLTIQDVKRELKGYELTKNVNAKIKSCRDTMSENYENHAKGVDARVLRLAGNINKHKGEIESKLLGYSDKIKHGIEQVIESIDEKIKLEMERDDKVTKFSSAKHLTIQDVKRELEGYELTKNVNAKIKSCRDTMSENYENHAKGVDAKLVDFKIEVEKAEKSILKKVLGNIS